MIETFQNLSHWLQGFAGGPWAVVVLALTSFSESVINPIPVDPLLIAMSVLNPNMAWLYAGVATVFSVLGALAGHWLGLKLGRPVALRLFGEARVNRVEAIFRRYGVWAVLVAAVTPIPYKVFAVTAGVMDMARKPFILASLVGRGGRFMLEAGLLFFFGDEIREFIETRFELLTLTAALAVLGTAALGLAFVNRHRICGAPVAGAPVAGTPVAGTPVAGTPVAGTPVAGTPVAGTPVAGTPVAGTPVAGTPVAGTPVAGTPVAGTPVAGTMRVQWKGRRKEPSEED